MTDKAALKEDVKKLVRALLISAPLGLTVRQVEEDFEAVMGYRLPYQKLGYDTAVELLKDMKDVVKPVWDRGQMKVMGICDDTTRHIQRMVMKQKVDTKKRGGVSKITRPTAQRQKSYRPAIGRNTNKSNYTTKPRQVKPMNKPVVPAHMQHEIKELLILFANGINATNFASVFNDEYGYTIDYKRLGFDSSLDFFKCIPDIEVETLKPGGFRIHNKTQLSIPPVPSVNKTKRNQPKAHSSEHHHDMSPSKVRNQNKSKRTDNFDDALVSNLRKVLSGNSNGFWANKLHYAYRKLTGEDLPLSKYGFFNVIDLVSAMPDVITIERPKPNGDWLLFDARLRISELKPQKARKSSTKEKGSVEVKSEKPKLTLDQLKVKIREVLEQRPGIVVQQLENAYEEIFDEELPLQDHGFMDVDTLVVMIPDALKVVYKGRGRLHLYPSKNESLGSLPEVFKPSYSKVPSDAIGSGVSYKFNDLPPLQEYIEVYVSNVVSPYNLTLQLKTDELLQLEDVMDELEEVYCSNFGEKYKMVESMIAINQVCAALYQQDGNWHRAIITGITNIDFVEVLYVDYGTTACVPKGLLRFLRSSMFHLPVQSVNARLSFIQPVEDKWTKAVQDRILQLCTDKALVALVTSIEGKVLSVCLTDTSTDEDVHINDLLVSENLAKFTTSTINVKPYSEYSLVTGYGLDIPTLVYDSNSYGGSAIPECKEVPVADEQKEEFKPNTSTPPRTPPRITLPRPAPIDAQFNRLSIDVPVIESGLYAKSAREEAREEVLTCAVPDEELEELVDEELMEQMNREMGGDFDDLESCRYIMYLDLGNDRTIHLINHDGIAYLPSANLRTLIDVDAVSQVMQIKQLGIQSVSLSREENPDLFAELDEYEVTRGPAAEGQTDSSPYITLYPLERIPSLVAVFEGESSDLSSILTQVFEQFDPQNPYWRGEISPAETKNESESDDLDLLKLMLQVWERKRQRILVAMMEDAGNVMVDELSDIELQISAIKTKIKEMQIEAEEIERGVVGDLVSQGHTSTTSRHSVPTDDHSSYPDAGCTEKDAEDILISKPSPVSVKSGKSTGVGETTKKMNVVEPFKPSLDRSLISDSQTNTHNAPVDSLKQSEIVNNLESFSHNGTTYYHSLPQHQSNLQTNQSNLIPQSNQISQSYMQNFRPSLPPPQANVLQPRTNMLPAPPGLPQVPAGVPNHQLPPQNMQMPRPNMQPQLNMQFVPPNMHQNFQPGQPRNSQTYLQQPPVHMQPQFQQPMPQPMPQFNQPMANQPNSMHQNVARFSTGQYYVNQGSYNYGGAYMGHPTSSSQSSVPFTGQSAAGVRQIYGGYWSTQH
ncbi:uncharacterized protein LOC117118617 [Anneissia japonica]|uniref:uncharacterized protein LOC117118617 n=1 Tax=Anneissia japonica TaxID=1529436 RepID=UPI00142582EB|nr:uncharacterized protein LOC117118617 [Anneissia japonica]